MRAMRTWMALSGAVLLAGCGGSTSPQTVGGSAPPTSGGGGSPTPTPTDIYSQFTNPVDAKTYAGIGGAQTFEYLTDSRPAAINPGQQAQVYAGNAGTVRSSTISLTYDPRDAIFTLVVTDPLSNTSTNTRFQDPASRTNFGGTVEPQWGTPNLNGLTGAAAAYNNPNIQYLQAGDGSPLSPYQYSGSGLVFPSVHGNPADGDPGSSITSTTLFYEKPGSTTKYVTYAGFVRNSQSFEEVTIGGTVYKVDHWHLERGAFAYGAQTGNSAVPVSGTGSYTGSMLATMVYNPTLDGLNGPELPTYFQWLTGTSKLDVNFGTKGVTLSLAGVVLDPQLDRYTTPQQAYLPAGTTFTASGSATIDLIATGGFKGSFVGGSFVFNKGGVLIPVTVAGSSIDGAFFGPNAEEAGGGFRVVGGIPDQRIDILGAFTGKK